jgi:DNA-binding transcriptional ArsR family regulator
MRKFMNLTKALADENRVRMLMALRGGELCVCQITKLFGLAPSTISKHLSILFQAGLIESRKSDRWVYYRLPDGAGARPVRLTLEWITVSVGKEEQILQDKKQLKQILKLNPLELCKPQCKK